MEGDHDEDHEKGPSYNYVTKHHQASIGDNIQRNQDSPLRKTLAGVRARRIRSHRSL